MKNLLLEMSNFYVGVVDITKDKLKTNNNGQYYLALNGNKDYIRPIHFHIYRKSDSHDFWTIEVNFQRFLCTGDPYIRRYKKGKDDDYPDALAQMRYQNIKKCILRILAEKPNVKKPDYLVGAIDNIDALIRIFNKEADIVRNGSSEYKNVPENEKLLTMMRESADKMKILPQFRKYFSAELQKKYADCFQ